VKSWGGGGNDAAPADKPMRTVTTSKRGEFALVAPTLVQTGYGERTGQDPRCLDLHQPLGTIVSCGGRHAVVQSTLEKKVAAFLYKGYGDENREGGFTGGQALDRPAGTITTRDHHSLAVSHMVKLRGTSDEHMDASSMPAESPAPTISAQGTHVGEVRAFLTKYHGDKTADGDGRGASLELPIPTIDTSNRFGLVVIDGDLYQITDIGMRMLTPRELFNCQGFPPDYIIDPVILIKKNGREKRLDKTGQVEKCGNSVPPPIARAIVASALSERTMQVAA
jgi:DNA (cytosine-5)-methyltransferase 1